MRIKNKYITVDFMGGDSLGYAIDEAMEFAYRNEVEVRFKFNGVPMAIVPDCPASVMFGKSGKLLKSMTKEWCRMIDSYVGEYRRKFDKRELDQKRKTTKRKASK